MRLRLPFQTGASCVSFEGGNGTCRHSLAVATIYRHVAGSVIGYAYSKTMAGDMAWPVAIGWYISCQMHASCLGTDVQGQESSFLSVCFVNGIYFPEFRSCNQKRRVGSLKGMKHTGTSLVLVEGEGIDALTARVSIGACQKDGVLRVHDAKLPLFFQRHIG